MMRIKDIYNFGSCILELMQGSTTKKIDNNIDFFNPAKIDVPPTWMKIREVHLIIEILN
jgi:hypothetical protein